jgi:formylglycine-generating enzyme required for sulfatase activity
MNHPVTGITWRDAAAFARFAGKRLPTEDEWEYAARAIDGRVYPWGNDFPMGKEVRCNCFEYARVNARAGTVEVGLLANGASPYGVHDMSGNVAEWTSTEVPSGDAKMRVIKGGSFMSSKEACRAAARYLDDPTLAHHEVGFRCVLPVEK